MICNVSGDGNYTVAAPIIPRNSLINPLPQLSAAKKLIFADIDLYLIVAILVICTPSAMRMSVVYNTVLGFPNYCTQPALPPGPSPHGPHYRE